MPCAAGWRSRRTRGQDAHVNTSAACISGAPPDGAAQADRPGAPCPSGQSGPVRAPIGQNMSPPAPPAPARFHSPEPLPDRPRGLPVRHRRPRPAAVRARPLRAPRHAAVARGGRPARWRGGRQRAGRSPCSRAAGHAARRARPRAKCRASLRKRRIASRVSPAAPVQAAAPCQNSRSSSRRFGAPSFSFLRSQGLPCRHCSGLV